jgi:hypothetical protein
MMAHPLALQLRNLQSLVEIGVDKNTTVVFPAPLMTTIAEVGAFLAREPAAARPTAAASTTTPPESHRDVAETALTAAGRTDRDARTPDADAEPSDGRL